MLVNIAVMQMTSHWWSVYWQSHLVISDVHGVAMRSTEVYLSWREVLCVQNGYMVGYYAICGSERNMQRSKSVMTTGNTIDGLTPLHMLSKWQHAVNINKTGPFTEPITFGGKWQVSFGVITLMVTTIYGNHLCNRRSAAGGSELYHCSFLKIFIKLLH